ncbi:unnamed protein product [Ambrosiozyma monospora]|uniref:Unnamed protein product n=1 Tax=Ambrosiozyma monospora TaxID=43982 RepID=A0A9W6T5S8_AMBMO|nr:unnamed protein product [Ambrosiozyma monospora]
MFNVQTGLVQTGLWDLRPGTWDLGVTWDLSYPVPWALGGQVATLGLGLGLGLQSSKFKVQSSQPLYNHGPYILHMWAFFLSWTTTATTDQQMTYISSEQ